MRVNIRGQAFQIDLAIRLLRLVENRIVQIDPSLYMHTGGAKEKYPRIFIEHGRNYATP